MRTSRIQSFIVALALMLMAGVAGAQTTTSQAPPPRHMHRPGMFGEMLPFHAVGLTDAQKTQIKQLYQAAKPTMQPLMQQLGQNHQAMEQLITGGGFDQAKAQALATQASQLHAQLEVEHAQIASQAYQLLTPEQKTKMSEILAKRQQWMQQHMQQEKEQADAQAESN
jgi:periplasmic protein CpxP/Spy